MNITGRLRESGQLLDVSPGLFLRNVGVVLGAAGFGNRSDEKCAALKLRCWAGLGAVAAGTGRAAISGRYELQHEASRRHRRNGKTFCSNMTVSIRSCLTEGLSRLNERQCDLSLFVEEWSMCSVMMIDLEFWLRKSKPGTMHIASR